MFFIYKMAEIERLLAPAFPKALELMSVIPRDEQIIWGSILKGEYSAIKRFKDHRTVPFQEPVANHTLRMLELCHSTKLLDLVPAEFQPMLIQTILIHDGSETILEDQSAESRMDQAKGDQNKIEKIDKEKAERERRVIRIFLDKYFNPPTAEYYEYLYHGYYLAENVARDALRFIIRPADYNNGLSAYNQGRSFTHIPIEIPLLVKMLDRIATTQVVIDHGVNLNQYPDYVEFSQKYVSGPVLAVELLNVRRERQHHEGPGLFSKGVASPGRHYLLAPIKMHGLTSSRPLRSGLPVPEWFKTATNNLQQLVFSQQGQLKEKTCL